jgi:DTW domain-containing protein
MRPTCPRCLRPSKTCFCDLVHAVDNSTELLILQHPLEVHQAKGTARLLQLCLARSRLLEGEVFDPVVLAPLLEGAVLLYPEEPGRPGPPLPAAAPQRLIVLDGTWRKSRKMLALNPLLQGLPRLSWREPPVSPGYRIRKAQQAHQLSTLEAAALALQQLEAQARQQPPGRSAAVYAPLWAAFEAFVARWPAPASPG